MINKQISVWRGQTPPPTVYHLWVYNNEIRKYSDGEWVNISTDRELMAKYLYSTRIRLSNAEDINHINIQSYTPDDRTQTYKYKGRVVIPVPQFGTYAVLIRLTGFENEAQIIIGDKTYNVGDVVSLKFPEVNNISLELTKYCYIKEILVQELASLDVIASSIEDSDKIYVKKDNKWIELSLDGFEVDEATNTVKLKVTDAMEEDNQLPISSRGVYNVVGNVQNLLMQI